jgi:hypothetical protein
MKFKVIGMSDDPKNSLADHVSKSSARSFGSNFIKGLTASGMMFAGALSRPKVPSTDMGSDWDAIGQDIRVALTKYAARVG